jgi:hypothetical protein
MHASVRPVTKSNRRTSGAHNVIANTHGNVKLHLAVNLIHLLATAGALIETAREISEWLHLY